MAKQAVNSKILFVDDEPNVLSGIKRQLRGQYKIFTADGGSQGLETIRQNGPFPVVVSDMRMPHMDGATFLHKVKAQAPNTVRILLTGQTDIESAVSAINDGQIFRFLLKPCPAETLTATLNAAITQYRLINAEKELLEKTLRGSIKVLTDILSLVNPMAFGGSTRSRRYINHLTIKLGLPQRWQYDLAAMLSQIGCVTVPEEIITKVYARQVLTDKEQALFDAHPAVGQQLISKIPRLQNVAKIIEGQGVELADYANKPLDEIDKNVLGGLMIRVALDLDHYVSNGLTLQAAIAEMVRSDTPYNKQLLGLLADLKSVHGEEVRKSISAWELTTAMTIDEDVRAANGALIVSKGQEVTEAMMARLKMMSENNAIQQPFRVLVRSQPAE